MRIEDGKEQSILRHQDLQVRIAILLPTVALAVAGQTFPIAGAVVDVGSGAPMGRVRITLTPSDRPTDQRAIITAADGRFSFNVPKGKF